MKNLPRFCTLFLLLATLTISSPAQKDSLLIGPGDLLHLQVYDTPEMEQHARVTDTGTVPFNFLGNVNVFHGRVQDGKMLLPGFEMAYPDCPSGESRAATAYVRPHELDIDRTAVNGSSLPARVLQINPNGSVAKVRLESQESNLELNVEINLDRYTELALKPGDLVHVAPRHFRVFIPEDYAI